MGLFRSYAKFQMGKKIFHWVRRTFFSNKGSTGRGARSRA